ncbi:MAG: hypothetical protein ABIQ15_10810 [Nocardioides sp.]
MAAATTGDSETLNVYVADIGGGLLGRADLPRGYHNGRDFIDGMVILDASMPGGTAGKYSLGDTLPHGPVHARPGRPDERRLARLPRR